MALVRSILVVFFAFLTSATAFSQDAQLADANTLRILTSMSERVFGPFVERFEAVNPDIRVLVLNKNTNHALGEVSLGNERGFDLFWASSPEAFDMLDEFDHLTPIDGDAYHAFALSSVGWSWRHGDIAEPPQTWNDLLDEKYYGKIGIARPSRSGTTHVLVEQFLQDRGWEDGWKYLLTLSSNFATITSRSFGVIDGLKSERFDIGLNIDFLAISEPDLAFRYGRPVMLVPARIAKLKNGRAPKLADKFITFVLSRAGQEILLTPSLDRIPMDLQVREKLDNSAYPELVASLKLSWASYDPKMAAKRYWMVNEIFDQFITNQFSRRRAVWRKIRIAEAQEELALKDVLRLKAARRYLVTMPVSEFDISRMQPSSMPGPGARYAPNNAEQQAFQRQWQMEAEKFLSKAELAVQALGK